jgi:hypothetical protein
MTLLNDKPSQLAMIVGNYVQSGGCTEVIGGTLTAGTMSASALLTFAPAFISAPSLFASVKAGIAGGAVMTASNFQVAFTGVTVSNAYLINIGGGSGCTVSILAIGQARL